MLDSAAQETLDGDGGRDAESLTLVSLPAVCVGIVDNFPAAISENGLACQDISQICRGVEADHQISFCRQDQKTCCRTLGRLHLCLSVSCPGGVVPSHAFVVSSEVFVSQHLGADPSRRSRSSSSQLSVS